MIHSNRITLVPIHEVSLLKRGKASQLIFDAIPEFYEIFGNKRNVLLAISELLGKTNSDISSGVMALDNDSVVGICTWVSNENLSSAQMYHLYYLRTKLAKGNEELSSKKALLKFSRFALIGIIIPLSCLNKTLNFPVV